MSMQSDDIREEIFKAINVLVKESLSKMDYLFLVEGVIENKDDFNRVYSFSYNGESHTAVSLTGEDFIEGDSVYVLFSNDRDIKKMIVGKRNRYASWAPIDQIPQIEGPAGKTSYTHIAYADSATGEGMSSSPVGKSYMGMYVDLIKEGSLDPSKYGWVLIKGSDGAPGSQGPQGVQGPAGKDGKATYTWIRYADTSTGGGISNSPTGKEYIGLAHNKETSTESNTPTDYTWSLIRGPQGESGNTGVEGPKGKDGKTTYTWIKYSANANGSGLTDTPQADTAYIGIATNKTVQDESSTPGDYIWSLFKGPKGEAGEVGPRGLQGQQGPEGKQGIQGSKGADGLSSYTHIAYATGTQGQGFNHETFPEATYIGMYVSSDQDSSGSWSDYEWTLVKGKDGSQGLRGPEGKDGKTPYFHTAWANDQTGTSGFSTTDSVDKIYIGTATTFESNDPTEPSAYNWTKIKGDKGDQGPKGATGAVGPRGDAGTSVEGIVEYYGLSTSDTVKPTSWVEVKSEATPLPKMTSVNKYLWNYEKINFSDSTSQNTIPVVVGAYGDTGQTGQTGSTGSAGVDGRSIVSIKDKYLVTSVSSGVTRSTSGWVDAPTATDDTNKYLWNYEIITWNKAPITTYVDPIIIGVHGLKGDTGEKGATGVQGPRGATGTSVESVTEYYLATSASSGILSTNPGFTTAIQTMTATNKYLWNYEKINFSDNTSQPTVPVIIGVYGDKGSTGSTGATGRSITGITEHYLASDLATGVTRSTSGWSTTMQPTTESKRYLWNYETITWSSGTMTTYVEPIVIGVHGLQGPKGDTGPKGATGSTGPKGDVGTSVSSVTEYYLASPASSGILATNPGFTTTMQPMTLTNKYLWNYEKINFSDGTDQPTIPVVIGVYGDRGPTGGIGPTGRSIVSVTEHYLATSANTGVTRSTSGWNTAMQPTTETNKYLWNYETVTWSATPLTTYVDPIIIGVHGAKGDKGDSGENAKLLYLSSNLESMIFNSDNTPNPLNQTATIEAKLQNVSGTIVYSATAYNGATSIGNVVLGGTGNVKTLSINNFPVNASHVSVTATLDSLTDTISIFKIRHGEKGFDGTDGTDGQNAIVGILTNESIAVPASENGTVTSFTGATGIFEVYDGTTRKTGSGVAYSVSGTPSGITVSINATTGAYTVSAMTSGTSVLSGNATLQAVYNGVTIKKVLTVTKAMTGKTGATGGTGASGSNAKIVTLTSSAQIFAKNASGVVSPASITVEGTSQNTSISAWEYSVDGGTFSSSLPTGLSRTGNVVSITGSSVTAKSISLRAKDASGVSDVLSIAVVQDGAKGDTGAKGATGSQGPKGATGTSVSSVTEYYLATSASSGVTASTSGWTETIQTMTATNKYLWNYEQINFSDGTNQPTLPVIIGAYGDKGQTGSTGATGRSITGITEHYLVSNLATGVTRTTSGWTTTMQQTDPTKKYLWNYETITWSSGTTTTYVEPIVIGIHGAQGVKGDTGSDAYTVVLSNEAHTFAGNTASAIASSVTVNVVAYKGATRVGATIGTISGAVEGMSTSIATNGTTTASFTVSVTTAMSTTNGLLTIPITIDGKLFSKTFSFALTLKGADGANGSAGANAKVIIVNPSAQIFTKDVNGNVKPSTITVDGTTQNVSISTWEYSIEGGAFSTSLPTGLTRSGNKVTITGSSMTAKNISVRASGSGVSDTTTIAMVQDGAKGSTGSTGAKGDSSIVGYLTNESVTLGASSTGVVSSFATASGTFRVFDGITEVTTNSACVFSLNSSTGVTLTINSSGVYTVTAMSADTATAEFKAVYKGITITKSMSLSKSRVGVTGGQGAKGDKGDTGAAGTTISSITEEYYLSTSKTGQIGSDWKSSPPAWKNNHYMWTRSKIVYTNPAKTEWTTPIVDSSWEAVNDYSNTLEQQKYYKYKEDIVVYGESDKFYPVCFYRGDQSVKRDILITRSYSERAPEDWNTATHKGGLTLKIKTNFGGWGGANYSWEIHELEEMYSKLFAGATNIADNMGFAVMLRGGGDGGAIYHIHSDQPLTGRASPVGSGGNLGPGPVVYYESDLLYYNAAQTYTWKAPAPIDLPLTAAQQREIDKRKFIQLAQKAVQSTDVEYYLSTSTTELKGGSWSTTAPTWVDGKYMWSRTKVTLNDGTTSYTPSADGTCIAGAKGATGATGVAGPKGDNGLPTYTWIAYATSAAGANISLSPTGKDYVGYASGQTSKTPSITTPSLYTWQLVKGPQGATGAQGKGISSTDIAYQAGSSGTTAPTGAWSTTVPVVSENQYLWTRTTITYTDNKTSTAYSVGKMGAEGPKGDDGRDGKGISSTIVTYQASASGTVTPTGAWQATVPSVAENQYLWTRVVIAYTSGSPTTSYSVGKMGSQGPEGAKGDKGDTGSRGATGEKGPTGPTGTSISSVVEWYLATNQSSGVTTSTSGWKTTMQTMTTTNKYLWNYEVVNFSDGSSSPTIPVIIGVHGNTGATGRALTGVTEYYLASASASGVTRPSTDGTNGWTTTIQTTSTDKPYLWNYEKLTWSVAPTASYIEPIIIGIHGARGPQGIQGGTGPKGDPVYTWIKYADTPTSGMTDDPTDKKYIGMAHNKPTATESTSYSDYTWSLMPQNITVGGRNYFSYTYHSNRDNYNFSGSYSHSNVPIQLQPNTEYTFSYEEFIRFESGQYVLFLIDSSDDRVLSIFNVIGMDGGTGPIAGKKEYHFTTNDDGSYRFSYYANGKNNNTTPEGEWFTDTFLGFQIEKGNTATDWTPAPEDVSQEIADAAGDVMEVVTTNYATTALLNDSITNEVAARTEMRGKLVEEIASQVKQSADSFDVIFKKIEKDQTLTNGEVELIQSYFRINENGVIIGKSGSDIEFFAENNIIGFREKGNDKPFASWEGGTMKVERLIALTTIMVGYHYIEKYDSPVAGKTTIVRIGG